MSKKLPAYAKEYKNHKVIIVFEDGSMEQQQVWGIDNGTIETENDILKLDDCTKYYNRTHAGFTYVFYMDLPAKVQAEELKELRRSKVIKNIMSYDRDQPFDIFKLMPWIITIVALMFAG